MLARLSFVIIGLIVLVGCGGGGGSSAVIPTDPNQEFSLAFVKDTKVGTLYTSTLSGSDSLGNSITGSILVANRAQELLGGILVTPQDELLNLNVDGIAISVTGTSYIEENGYLVLLTIQTTGVTCTPSSPIAFPDFVKVGDFGILPSLICDDNTTQETNWRVEDGKNGNILLVTSSVIKDQFNSKISTTEITYTIDSNGNLIAFKTISTDIALGYTMTYQSI
jgi:hypothetical protein